MAGPPPAQFCTLSLDVAQLTDGDPPAPGAAELSVVSILNTYAGAAPVAHDKVWTIPLPAHSLADGSVAIAAPMGCRLLMQLAWTGAEPGDQPARRAIVLVPFDSGADITSRFIIGAPTEPPD